MGDLLHAGTHQFEDRFPAVPRREIEVAEGCQHAAVLGTVEPAFHEAIANVKSSCRFRLNCPDCLGALDLRFYRAQAGGWYLWMQERLAAGRQWCYRCEGDRWIAGV